MDLDLDFNMDIDEHIEDSCSELLSIFMNFVTFEFIHLEHSDIIKFNIMKFFTNYDEYALYFNEVDKERYLEGFYEVAPLKLGVYDKEFIKDFRNIVTSKFIVKKEGVLNDVERVLARKKVLNNTLRFLDEFDDVVAIMNDKDRLNERKDAFVLKKVV